MKNFTQVFPQITQIYAELTRAAGNEKISPEFMFYFSPDIFAIRYR